MASSSTKSLDAHSLDAFMFPDMLVLLELGSICNTEIMYGILSGEIDENLAEQIEDIKNRIATMNTYIDSVNKKFPVMLLLISKRHTMEEMEKVGHNLGFKNIASIRERCIAKFCVTTNEKGHEFAVPLQETGMDLSFLLAYTLVANYNVKQTVICSNSGETGELAINALDGLTWLIPMKEFPKLVDFTFMRLYFDPKLVTDAKSIIKPHVYILDTLLKQIIEPMSTKANSWLGSIAKVGSSIGKWFS